jgi:mono/diheme cytochrome c family protein
MKWRRAPQRFVAGAALVVLLLTAGCSDSADMSLVPGSNATQQVAMTVVTTAPVEIETPRTSPTPLFAIEPSAAAILEQELLATPTSVAARPDAVVATADLVPTVSPERAATVTPLGTPTATLPTLGPTTPVPITGSQEVLVANGAEVYTLNCARCHGENGLGTGQYRAGLIGVGSQYSSQAMIIELTTGHPVTFGFADRLSAEEIASVVAYVKSVFP